MNEHVTDLAESYAIGALDTMQRDAVDAHVAVCRSCAARVGEAEQTVAALVEQHEASRALDARVRRTFAPPRRAAAWLLPAAAFVLGLLPSLWMWNAAQHRAPLDADRTAAVTAMVSSHFSHAQFVPLAADAPGAKMLYAKSVSWRYVVARAQRPYTLAAQENGRTIPLGTLHARGGAAELFLPDAPYGTFVLLDGGRAVARVTLPYRR